MSERLCPRCGKNPVKFATVSVCEDCHNEPIVLGLDSRGKPIVFSQLPGDCITHYTGVEEMGGKGRTPGQEAKIDDE
jgi:hypothetical protein